MVGLGLGAPRRIFWPDQTFVPTILFVGYYINYVIILGTVRKCLKFFSFSLRRTPWYITITVILAQ